MDIHADCKECCGLGRCHWCLGKSGPVVLFDTDREMIFRACSMHAELVHSSNRFPKLTVIGYDGTFRPKELVIDEEAAKRASVSIHNYSTSTPTTLR